MSVEPITTDRMAEAIMRAYASVSVPALEAARLHLLDALGVGIVAAHTGPVSGVRSLAQSGGSGPCSVIGSAATTSPAVAALINGTLIHSLEFDDTHVASVMHGSSVIAPAAVAAAQSVGASGRQLLSAFTLGWEVLIRLGLASPGRIQARGFQITSAAGAFAAAAVSCLLNEDTADVLANALGVAGSQGAGTFAFLAQGDTVKAAQPGWAAHAGLLAADLARAGVTGPSSVFTGRFGFFSLYADDPDAAIRLAELTETIGQHWHLSEAAYKLMPCCHYIHPFIEGLATALEGTQPDEVVGIHCWVPDGAVPVIAEDWPRRQNPVKAHDARWSLPYVLGLFLRDGRVSPGAFTGQTAPDIVARAHQITFEPWHDSGFPERFPARLSVQFRDGRVADVTIEDVRGGLLRPIMPGDVIEKARVNLLEAGIPSRDAEALITEVVYSDEPRLEVISTVMSMGGHR